MAIKSPAGAVPQADQIHQGGESGFVGTPAPCCWAAISFSCTAKRLSSSTASANGRPTTKADVTPIQMSLPAIQPPKKPYADVVCHIFDNLARVVGDIMSLNAEIRSQRLSLARITPRSSTSSSSERSSSC